MKLNKLKKLSFLIVLGILLIIVAEGVTSNDASGRAIIVGVGVDFDTTHQQYVATSEILSPSGAGGVQSSTKYFVTRGETVSQALGEIYRQTGELTSLGQCQILILGEDLYKNHDIRHTVTYFNLLEALVDSASICCCVGSAFDLMQTQTPHEQSTSFSLIQILKDASDSVSLPTRTIGEFCKNQLSVGKSDAMSLVEYVWQEMPSNNSEIETDAQMVSYNCGKTAVFKNYNFVTTLDQQTTRGYALLASSAVGQHYSVTRDEPRPFESTLMSVVVADKDASIDCVETAEGYFVSIELDIGLQSSNRAYWGDQGKEHPLIKRTILPEELKEVKEKVQHEVELFVEAQKKHNFDISKIFRSFEGKYGKSWREKSQTVALDQMQFEIKVQTHET